MRTYRALEAGLAAVEAVLGVLPVLADLPVRVVRYRQWIDRVDTDQKVWLPQAKVFQPSLYSPKRSTHCGEGMIPSSMGL